MLSTYAIHGELTFETIASAQKQVTRFLAQSLARENFVDLAAVTAVNSAALALLIELKKVARLQNQTLRFLNLPPHLLVLAQLYGVAAWLELIK